MALSLQNDAHFVVLGRCSAFSKKIIRVSHSTLWPLSAEAVLCWNSHLVSTAIVRDRRLIVASLAEMEQELLDQGPRIVDPHCTILHSDRDSSPCLPSHASSTRSSSVFRKTSSHWRNLRVFEPETRDSCRRTSLEI